MRFFSDSQNQYVQVGFFFNSDNLLCKYILVQKARQGSLCSKLFSVDDLPTPRRERERERSHDKRWHSWWGIWKSGDPVVRDRRWQRDIRSKHDHLVGDLQGENEMTKFQQSTWILKQILICIWWDNLHKTTSYQPFFPPEFQRITWLLKIIFLNIRNVYTGQ